MPILDPRHVAARRVLLDALTALAPYGEAVIVAGAQAVYLRTAEVDIAVAPFTTDGDLALDPSLLGPEPALELTMREAGFDLLKVDGHVEPGIWEVVVPIAGVEAPVLVDLIVPEGVATGGGRRGARLGPHGKRAARRATGLEAALIDHSPMTVVALDAADERAIEVEVAGPAALLVAKAHKLGDRIAGLNAARVIDKDAGDVFRLMRATSPSEVGARLAALSDDPVAGRPSADGLLHMDSLFGRRGAAGIELAARALRLAVPRDRVEAVCVDYTVRLVAAARAPTGGRESPS